MRLRIPAMVGILAAGLATASCSATSGEPSGGGDATSFFEGQTIEIVVTTGVGGGTDNSARFLGPLIAAELPGEPAVQVVNVEGGNHIPGMEEFAGREPSALSLLMSSGSGHLPPLLGMGVDYSFDDWEPLIVTQGSQLMLISTASGIGSAKEATETDEPLFYGGGGPIGTDTARMLGLELLGVNFEASFGFSGGEERVAFEQGEVDLMNQTSPLFLATSKPELVDTGKAMVLYANGQLQDGEIVRDEAIGDIPTIVEVYEDIHGEEPSGDAWEAFKALLGPTMAFNNILWIHKDAPEDAKAAIHAAIAKVVASDAFADDAVDALGPYPVLIGETAATEIEAAFQIAPETTAWISDWLFERFDVRPE